MNPIDFGSVVRRTCWSSVEFSVSDATDAYSTMVPASAELFDDLRDRLGTLPFADAWLVAVERLMAHLAPDAALFRIDWQRAQPVAFTWYVRFPGPPDDDRFDGIMAYAQPWSWSGPVPSRVASALGLSGPRGVALRIGRDGAARTAVYFRLQRQAGPDAPVCFEPIFDAAGLSGDGAAHASADFALLGASGQVEVIGIDGAAGSAGAVKVDVADVPVSVALRLLSTRGADDAQCQHVARLATSLRARALGYLGLKYSATSFDGWRAYFTTEPVRVRPAAGVRLVEQGASGKLRAPHY